MVYVGKADIAPVAPAPVAAPAYNIDMNSGISAAGGGLIGALAATKLKGTLGVAPKTAKYGGALLGAAVGLFLDQRVKAGKPVLPFGQ